MRASQLQQMLKFNAEALTEMYKRYGELRKERKKFNNMGDDHFKLMMVADDELDFDKSRHHYAEGDNYREQASIFTPEINKLKARIAKLSALQVVLKNELSCAQCLSAWSAEDESEWTERFKEEEQEEFLHKEGIYEEIHFEGGLEQ